MRSVHAGQVGIHLTDGRCLELDQAQVIAEPRQLMLRLQNGPIRLTRRISWQRLHSVRLGKRTFDATALKAGASQGPIRLTSQDGLARQAAVCLASATELTPCPSSDCCRRDAKVIGIRRDPLSAYYSAVKKYFPDGVPLAEVGFIRRLLRAQKARQVLGSKPGPLPSHRPRPHGLPPLPGPKRPIQSISARAAPISRHGKVDWDTLAVTVLLRGDDGPATGVRGTLQATLWGREQELVQAYPGKLLGRVDEITKIGTWTRKIGLHRQQGRGRIRVSLPLPRPLPDHDLSVAPFGELHVKLLVPGHGVFETIQKNVPLRHRGRFRDRVLLETGTRFFSREGTFDSRRRPAGLGLHGLSQLGPNRRIFSVEP